MIAWIIAALAVSQPPTPTISVAERAPLALIILTPAGVPSSTLPLSEMTRLLHDNIERESSLAVLDVTPSDVLPCQGALYCIFDRSAASVRKRSVPYVVVVSSFALKQGADRYAFVVIDGAAAERCAGESDRDLCAERAVLARSSAQPASEASAKDALIDFVRGPLKKAVGPKRWYRFGELLLRSAPNAWVQLDGKPIGRAGRDGALRVTGLEPGAHALKVSAQGFEPQQSGFSVGSGAAAELSLRLRKPTHPGHWPTIYGGGAAAFLGAALVIWGAAYHAQNSSASSVCFDDCASSSFWTLEQMFSGRPEIGAPEANRGALLAIPLGYSLVLAGGAAAVWRAFFSDAGESPWLELAVSLGLGVLSYGVSAAVNAAR